MGQFNRTAKALAAPGGAMSNAKTATLAAAVRSYLGLSQLELAVYLGVTRGQVAHVEAGQRLLTGEASRRLSQLARARRG